MNPSKFIVTVLGTSLYTSAWWWLSMASKEMAEAFAPWSIICAITIFFGTGAAIVGIGIWVCDNWDKR